jgi:hypothetical protein
MLQVQKQFDSLCETAQETPGPERVKIYGDKREKLNEMLDDILENNLSLQDMRRLAVTCGSVPALMSKQDDFTAAVLEHMFKAFLIAADRESLVTMLAIRFPDPLGYANVNTESYLAVEGTNLKAPILVLGEAYSRSQVPDTRRLIAAAVRRGFTSSGVRGKDDAAFVKNAMQWYEKEKGHLVPNSIGKYRLFAPEEPDDLLADAYRGKVPERHYENHPPLFVEKP